MPYPDDPAARRAILDALAATWPHVPAAIERAARWGSDWCAVSTPFVRWSGARAVSVVGVIELPLRIGGVDRIAAGVHGVTTHPAHRGRGYVRDALEEALAWIDARTDLALLWTEEPAIYERFGFRVARESVFEVPGAIARSEGPVRALDLDDRRDLELVHATMRARVPTGDRIATRDPGWHARIDLALLGEDAPRLVHLPDLDALVAIAARDGALRIDDVWAPRPVALDAILARVGPAPRVELAISPDALAPHAVARPHPATDVLMVRGAFPIDEPFALSPLART